MKMFKFARFTSSLLFAFVLFYSSQSSAQCCVTVTGYKDPVINGTVNVGIPAGTPLINQSMSPEAMKAQADAQKKACADMIDGWKGAECRAQATAIQNQDKNTCNNIAYGGAVVSGVATAVMTYMDKPKNVATKLIWAAAAVVNIGGATATIYGTGSCMALADANKTFNDQQCKDYVSSLQAEYCK